MKNIVISKLDKQDIKEAAALVQKLADYTLEKRSDIFVLNYENWEQNLKERIDNNNFELIVAKDEKKIVGVCIAEIKHIGDGEITNYRDILFIEYVVVLDEYKKMGIGSKMLNYMKHFAKQKALASLELTVWGYNKNAIGFYEKNDMKIKRTIYEYMMDGE